MLIINFEGREAKGLSKGRYDETFTGEDANQVKFDTGMETFICLFVCFVA